MKENTCHLTTADFVNQTSNGPFLDENWKCRVPGCGNVAGQHNPAPAPAPAPPAPGNYRDSGNCI